MSYDQGYSLHLVTKKVCPTQNQFLFKSISIKYFSNISVKEKLSLPGGLEEEEKAGGRRLRIIKLILSGIRCGLSPSLNIQPT